MRKRISKILIQDDNSVDRVFATDPSLRSLAVVLDSFTPFQTLDDRKHKRNKCLSISRETQLEFNLKDKDIEMLSK